MDSILIIGGATALGAGLLGPYLLPQAPAALQNVDSPLYPIGAWIIDNSTLLIVIGILLLLLPFVFVTM
jgi:hypothetical protein